MFCNVFIQDSSTQMEHLFFSKVLLLLPNFPAGLTEAQGSQVTCPGQTASVARNRLEPAILLTPYPALDHAPFYKLFFTREKSCPLFLLVYSSYSKPPSPPKLFGLLIYTYIIYMSIAIIYITMHSSLIFPAVWSPDPSLEPGKHFYIRCSYFLYYFLEEEGMQFICHLCFVKF